ncbi:hypothetical protein [Chitinophaga vietnamensis]|uniref:hypothetical protein n=1 Tax=Chitinophaga vietnamensis TaxID=2593957 RepID=UPI00117855DB|nr:hypothetical protein [Chitinophaga vietnamensis]
MPGHNEKLKVVLSMIMQKMESTLKEMRASGPGSDINVRAFSTDQPLPDSDITITRSDYHGQQEAVLRSGLQQLCYSIPAMLFNAGISDSVLPASSIHLTLSGSLLHVYIDGYGEILLNIRESKGHALLWQDEPVNAGHPIDINEVSIAASTMKRAYEADHDYTKELIEKDYEFLKKQLEEYLHKKGAPTKATDFLPRYKINWIKYKELVRKLGPLHEVYKGLIKSNTLMDVYDISTAKVGQGNVPGLDALTGGMGSVIVDNVMQPTEALLMDFIRVAEITPSWKGGGYRRMPQLMKYYNSKEEEFKHKFVGTYLHEEELKALNQQTLIDPKALHLSSNFMETPHDDAGKPLEIFLYIRTDKLQTELVNIRDFGVIYVNPGH